MLFFVGSSNSFYSWVGIIMYFFIMVEVECEVIINVFMEYGYKEFDVFGDKYEFCIYWVKIEVFEDIRRFDKTRIKFREYYSVKEFNVVCKYFDFYGVFMNGIIVSLFK